MQPSRGKTARDENFPVASRLLDPALRPAVLRFYAFARAADDVADSPDLAPAEKAARLAAFEAGLDGMAGPEEARALAAELAARGLPDRHARALLVAFRRDAAGEGCADWAALEDYCSYSAHPVGRFMLDLHGAPAALWPRSDALCAALQILNHVQDCRADYLRLRRVYLPADWMAAEGVAPEALGADRATPGLARVIARTLDRCEGLIGRAAGLAEAIPARRLAGQVAATDRLAQRLLARLRGADPLARRVALSPADFAWAAAFGLAAAARRPAPAAAARAAH